MRNLLITVLLLTIGLSLAPQLVAVVMDVFAITIHSTLGWDLGVGFVQNTLGIWPGGEVIAAVMFDRPLTAPGLVSGVLQVLIVSLLRSHVPPLLGGPNTDFRVKRLLGIGLLDAAITCLIAIAVGWAFTAWFDGMFHGVVGLFALTVVGGGALVVLATVALGAFGVFRRGNVLFAFSIMTALGRFALTTFALITWSVNSLAGAFTVVACVVACGVLALVDGRQARYW